MIMANKLLKKEKLASLINGVVKKGGVFVAPKNVARQVVYCPVTTAEELAPDYIAPRNSFKEVFFPQTEVIAEFKTGKEGTELSDAKVTPKKTVVFGSRPCDAASGASLRSVFTWDFVDEFYTKREDNSIVMSIACTKGDESCFCATVGLKPDSTDGSDILLREAEDGNFAVQAVTEKGKAFIQEHKDAFEDDPGVKTKEIFKPTELKNVDLKTLSENLKKREHYEDVNWVQLAAKCIGCGACTFSCPTCHCFDITDEGSFSEGERRKNWDACQFDFFTLHASGHNPRDAQYKRWRNRFMCKFNIYPEKFKTKGCVGCGRCVRVCPVRLDITEVMAEMSKI